MHGENVLTWAKRVESPRTQTAVISSLHEAKTVIQLYKKMSGTSKKDPQQIHSALEEDVDTADKNTNQDDAQHMERGWTNVACQPF